MIKGETLEDYAKGLVERSSCKTQAEKDYYYAGVMLGALWEGLKDDNKFELGQRFFFVDYTDQIQEGVVTKIIQEENKDTLYFFKGDCFTSKDMFLDFEELYSQITESYETEFNWKKNRLAEMRDKYLKEQEILQKEAK